MHSDTLESGIEAKIEEEQIVLSNARKYTLLALFCSTQFVDVYNASAIVLATADVADGLNMGATEGVWTLSAYVLTFASFMLPFGKIADIWSAKGMLVLGILWVGAFSIGIAVTDDKVVLFVLRAFAGLGAAAGIPAAINLIIHVFPGEAEQHVALAAFGGAGELANIGGFIIGGILLLASWRWVFWLLPIVCFPLAGLAFWLVPGREVLKQYQLQGLRREAETEGTGAERARELLRTLEVDGDALKFDYVGSFLVVAAAVLSVFGLTDGGEGSGWGRAQPITTLVIGLLLFPVFFWWESRIDQRTALIPSSIWRIRNVTVLTVVSLVPYFWWYGVQYIHANVMQIQWGVSSIMTAVHFLPISIGGGIIFILIGYLPPSKFPLKIRMVVGAIIGMIGTILLVFGQNQDDYWKFVATGFFIGSIGIAMVFISANNSLLMAVPTEYSGVVGGVFNATLQLGAVAGLAINATIQSFFPDHAAEASGEHRIAWKGYQSNFIFMASLTAVLAIVSAIWFKNPYVPHKRQTPVQNV
ncbi:hypothetical protein NliqN6_3425 [Naganishia liquefaciens]|uniref:Major facilitator superfamily (MFS) profile domain-containing protein n=1 Tax=Naganishia liquefaciens TaxID=104408 RepID=A0A8H3YF84_9TREE|nr:hypothetical protein NliqN6_3425 [Naganishia liquefaciens]